MEEKRECDRLLGIQNLRMTPTIEELIEEYNNAAIRQREEWKKIAHLKGEEYKQAFLKSYHVPYDDFTKKLGEVIKYDFKLTDKQAGYLMGEAHARYHSSFGDIFWGAYQLAEFVTKFPKD